MTEFKKEQTTAQPEPGRFFFQRHTFVIPPLSTQLIFWPIMVLGCILDLWSKRAVFAWLEQKPFYKVSVIDGFLQLVRAENAGAAFGIASGQRYLLVAVSLLALIIILAIIFFSRIEHKLIYIALGLFMAGVCGNLYDRIFHGGLVRDFIDVYYGRYHWPAFNVADSMLCIGVGLMIICSFFTCGSPRDSLRRANDRPSQKHAQLQK